MTTATTPTDPRAANGSNRTLDALVAGCNACCPRCHAPITSEQLTSIFQITGKGTYSGVQGTINSKCAGSGIDVVTNPDSASTPKGGMVSAMAYWYWKTPSLNRTADPGDVDSTVNAITRRVRGGSDPTIDTERRRAVRDPGSLTASRRRSSGTPPRSRSLLPCGTSRSAGSGPGLDPTSHP